MRNVLKNYGRKLMAFALTLLMVVGMVPTGMGQVRAADTKEVTTVLIASARQDEPNRYAVVFDIVGDFEPGCNLRDNNIATMDDQVLTTADMFEWCWVTEESQLYIFVQAAAFGKDKITEVEGEHTFKIPAGTTIGDNTGAGTGGKYVLKSGVELKFNGTAVTQVYPKEYATLGIANQGAATDGNGFYFNTYVGDLPDSQLHDGTWKLTYNFREGGVYIDGTLHTNVPIKKLGDRLWYVCLNDVGLAVSEGAKVQINGSVYRGLQAFEPDSGKPSVWVGGEIETVFLPKTFIFDGSKWDEKHIAVHHPAVEPTAEADGNIEYWSCEECPKKFADEACTTEVEKVTLYSASQKAIAPRLEAYDRQENNNRYVLLFKMDEAIPTGYDFDHNNVITLDEKEITENFSWWSNPNAPTELYLFLPAAAFGKDKITEVEEEHTVLVKTGTTIGDNIKVGTNGRYSFAEDYKYKINGKEITRILPTETVTLTVANRDVPTNGEGLYFDTHKGDAADSQPYDAGWQLTYKFVQGGVSVNGERKNVTVKKLGDRLWYVCLKDGKATVSAGDRVTISGSVQEGRQEYPNTDKPATWEGGKVETIFAPQTFLFDGEKWSEVHTGTHHEAVPATCEKEGCAEYWECDECGKLYSDAECTKEVTKADLVLTAGHKLTHIAQEDATCTAEGTKAYWECEACKAKFSDAEGKNAIDKPETIEKAAHKLTHVAKVAATCTKAGHDAYYTCDVCKKVFADAEGTKEAKVKVLPQHKATEVKAVASTYTKTGVAKHYKCSCGKLYTDKACTKPTTKAKLTTPVKKLTVAKTSVKSVTAKSKALAINWTKKSGVTGYEVQVALKNNFKSGLKKATVKGASKTTVTIKKLKAKKTYYVRVRAYKKVEGKTFYSSWSNVKSKKTK